MTAADAGLVLAGVAVLGLLVVEVFATVLHHWGGSGPLGRAATRLVWAVARRSTSGLDARRRRVVLGYVGPFLIPLALLLWGALAIGGFALLYRPWMPHGFNAVGPTASPGLFTDALYFSGVTFFTLGFGDLVPTDGWMRVLAVAESGSGFALITLAISYFTSVFPAYSHQQVLADSVLDQTDGTADAARLIAQQLRADPSGRTLAAELARLRDGLARVQVEYGSYPILHHFVASVPGRSLVRLLFVLQDTVLLLDVAVHSERHPELAGLGERTGLGRTCARTRADLVRTLGGRRPRPAPDPGLWTEHFQHASRTLQRAGLAVQDDRSAAERYQQGRAAWEPELRAAAEALGEAWAEISARG